MRVSLFSIIIFGLLTYAQAQTKNSNTDFSGPDTSFYKLEKHFFQMSHPIILADTLVHHREFSALNHLSNSLGKSYSRQGLIATTILANWSAFYLKRMADDSYKQYLKAGNKNQIQSYYRKAGRYDDYATAAIVVSAAALSAYMWFLFTD